MCLNQNEAGVSSATIFGQSYESEYHTPQHPPSRLAVVLKCPHNAGIPAYYRNPQYLMLDKKKT